MVGQFEVRRGPRDLGRPGLRCGDHLVGSHGEGAGRAIASPVTDRVGVALTVLSPGEQRGESRRVESRLVLPGCALSSSQRYRAHTQPTLLWLVSSTFEKFGHDTRAFLLDRAAAIELGDGGSVADASSNRSPGIRALQFGGGLHTELLGIWAAMRSS
jgi:hypothetical protein